MFSLIKNESWGTEDDQIPSMCMVARLKLKGIDGRAPPGVEHAHQLIDVDIEICCRSFSMLRVELFC